MLNKTLFAAVLTLTSVAAFAGPKCTAYPQNERIPAAKFQENLKKQGYQIRQFKETKGNCYEIYGKDKQGRKVEIYFDAKTGQAVKSEIDD